MKIFYLTRSYFPYQKGGGPIMRTGAVNCLQKNGWQVQVITPNYNNHKIINDGNVLLIPFDKKHIQKLSSLYERVGIYEDYLDKWIDIAFIYLRRIIKKEDIVFSTSGGELGMIKLGSILKKYINCRFVVNFRDPLNYGFMPNLKKDNKPHIGREGAEEKYIANSDLILTSSVFYADILKSKFKKLKDKIHNNYFGYIEGVNLLNKKKNKSRKLRIAYTGIMSNAQSPEILFKAFKQLNDKNIELFFIGDSHKYKPINEIKNSSVHIINFLPHKKFLDFMSKNIDVGFVSLTRDYYGACIPSKIYEYINLGLPIIGSLPNGDCKDIINNNNFGFASHYDDVPSICDSMIKLSNKKILNFFRDKVIEDRDIWSMDNKINEILNLLKSLSK
jgi:hypothetical protein